MEKSKVMTFLIFVPWWSEMSRGRGKKSREFAGLSEMKAGLWDNCRIKIFYFYIIYGLDSDSRCRVGSFSKSRLPTKLREGFLIRCFLHSHLRLSLLASLIINFYVIKERKYVLIEKLKYVLIANHLFSGRQEREASVKNINNLPPPFTDNNGIILNNILNKCSDRCMIV